MSDNDKQPSKSRAQSCDASKNQSGVENQIKGSGSLEPTNEANKLHLNDNTDTICSDTWISFQELEASAWQQSNLGEFRQLSLLKSTPTLKQSCNRASQEYQFTQTSEIISPEQENSTSLQWDFPAREHQTQELEQDSSIQLHHFGEKVSDVLSNLNPASVLSSNLKELSNEDFELFLGDCLWQDTLGRLAMCRQQSLGRVIKGSGYSLFPTLTSNVSSTSRPAGQTKCEKWFKDNGLIPNGSQLGTKAIAMIMGFPPNWFDCLSPIEPQAELEQDTSQEEQLHQHKQPLPSAESLCEAVSFRATSTVLLGGEDNSLLSTESSSSLVKELSIPCLVKQPKQPEVKGIIRKDEGDRFLVEVNGEEISVSKFFVYPDFSETVRQIEKSPSKISTPSKTRRRKGEGNGSIHWRTVTRNGKEYRQAYYHWVEGGKKRTKYIPKKLLDRVTEAESRKLPIADILILLGGKKINPSKSSDTFVDKYSDNSESDLEISPRKITPPSNKKRKQGEGTGYIECKPIKRGGKEYKQYWYHYEEWQSGDRITKKSKYIPQKMRSQIEKMNNDKVPVKEILRVLSKRSKE